MDFSRQIFNYCERAGDGAFWAEPANALTNAGFIVAAVLALVMAVRRGRLDGPVIWLICLTFVIGVGSFLFHTFATAWAAIADTAPITIFILSYFAIALRAYGGRGWGRSLILTLAFLIGMVAVSALLRPLNDALNGSQSYIPAILGLLGVGFWLARRGHPAGGWLLAVAVIFAGSLTLRALDQRYCDSFALGTHWLWHLMNSVVLGTLIAALIRYGERRGRDA